MKGPFGDSVIALTGLFLSLVLTYNRFCLSETTSSNGDIDLETLSMFGVTPEFAEQFRLNLIKAIEAEEKEQSALRQGEFGGVSGGFFQGGNQGGGGQGGGGGGGDEGEDDEDDMPMMMVPGPGAFGVLSGLFGIFSGLGSLNPSRIIQSTVNFFPPGQRQMAQMIVDSLIGYVPPENRTLRPPTSRPRVRVTPTPLLPLNETMIAAELDAANSTVIDARGNETVVAKDAESGANETMTGGVEDTMPMAEVMSAIATPRPKTTPGPINIHKLLNQTTLPPPEVHEDDEEDVEKKYTTPRSKPVGAGAAGYKLKQKPSPASETVTAAALT